MLTLDRATADQGRCRCGVSLWLWWNMATKTFIFQHGDGEAVRTFTDEWISAHGYSGWLAEVHEYERQRLFDEIMAQARELEPKSDA